MEDEPENELDQAYDQYDRLKRKLKIEQEAHAKTKSELGGAKKLICAVTAWRNARGLRVQADNWSAEMTTRQEVDKAHDALTKPSWGATIDGKPISTEGPSAVKP